MVGNFVLTTSGEKVWWKIILEVGTVVKSKILGFHHSVCAQRKMGHMGGYILDLSFLLG